MQTSCYVSDGRDENSFLRFAPIGSVKRLILRFRSCASVLDQAEVFVFSNCSSVWDAGT